MEHQSYMTWIYNIIFLLGGLLISIFLIVNHPTTDGAPIFELINDSPPKNTFDVIYSNDITAPPTRISQNTTAALVPQCYSRLLGMPTLAPTSPLCECLTNVLLLFSSTFNKVNDKDLTTKEKFSLAGPAYTACFYTHLQVPRSSLVMSNAYDDSTIATRNVLNRSTFIIIIWLSYVFNAIYNSLDFEGTNYFSNNKIKLVFLVVVVLAQLLAPFIASSASSPGRIILGSGSVVLSAFFVQGILVEYFWSYITKYKRRSSFIHPYVFSTTLQSLLIIAMIENGVFDYVTIATVFLIAHALALAYTGLLFFLFMGCIEPIKFQNEKSEYIIKGYQEYNSTASIQRPTLMGYLILLGAIALVVVSMVQPHFPTAPERNVMWLMPWIFVAAAVVIPVYIEHAVDRTSDPDVNKAHFVWTSHIGFFLYSLLVFIVLMFYLMRIWQYNYGEKVHSEGARALSNINYGPKMNPALIAQYTGSLNDFS